MGIGIVTLGIPGTLTQFMTGGLDLPAPVAPPEWPAWNHDPLDGHASRVAGPAHATPARTSGGFSATPSRTRGVITAE